MERATAKALLHDEEDFDDLTTVEHLMPRPAGDIALRYLPSSPRLWQMQIEELLERNARLEQQVRHLADARRKGVMESRLWVVNLVFYIAACVALLVLALFQGIPFSALWPFWGVIAGSAAGSSLIHEAGTTRRGSVSKVLFYAGGLFLWLETIMLIHALLRIRAE